MKSSSMVSTKLVREGEDSSLRWVRVYGGSEFTVGPSLRWVRVYGGSEFTMGPSLRRIRVYGGSEFTAGPI